MNGVYTKILSKCDRFETFVGFVDPHTVEDTEGRKYTSKYFIIATGSTPFVPDIEGKEHLVTSDDAFFFEELPKRILINGGGYIGVSSPLISDSTHALHLRR